MPRKHEQSLSEKMHAKDWRALPQNVALGGDTKSAKRRRARDVLRAVFCVVLVLGSVALLVFVWTEMTRAEETRPVELEFVNDGGVLDRNWFLEWSGFDETRAPNLNALRRRLLEYPQVRDAKIFRQNEGKIRVVLRERRPIARWCDEGGNAFLVADDGVLFPAATFPRVQSMLPVLIDVKPTDDGNGFPRIANVRPLAEFIELARTRYPTLFKDWDTISLKNFPADARELAMPWSELRVELRASSQNPKNVWISHIVFSPDRFRDDLKLLSGAVASGELDKALGGGAGTPRPAAAYIRFITNRKNPDKECREMRIIPIPAGTP